jgi:hypothetical protein
MNANDKGTNYLMQGLDCNYIRMNKKISPTVFRTIYVLNGVETKDITLNCIIYGM